MLQPGEGAAVEHLAQVDVLDGRHVERDLVRVGLGLELGLELRLGLGLGLGLGPALGLGLGLGLGLRLGLGLVATIMPSQPVPLPSSSSVRQLPSSAGCVSRYACNERAAPQTSPPVVCFVAKDVYSSETRTSLRHGCSARRNAAVALLCLDIAAFCLSLGRFRPRPLRHTALRSRDAPSWRSL